MSIRAINWAREIGKRIQIPSRHRLALLTLAAHHHDKTGSCFPSYDTIAEECGCSRRKVIGLVADLEANGVVIRQKRRRGSRQGSNQFVLFGQPSADKWSAPRVQTGAPSKGGFQSAQKSTLSDTPARVQTGAPDREYNTSSDLLAADVVPFPVQKIATGGRG